MTINKNERASHVPIDRSTHARLSMLSLCPRWHLRTDRGPKGHFPPFRSVWHLNDVCISCCSSHLLPEKIGFAPNFVPRKHAMETNDIFSPLRFILIIIINIYNNFNNNYCSRYRGHFHPCMLKNYCFVSKASRCVNTVINLDLLIIEALEMLRRCCAL